MFELIKTLSTRFIFTRHKNGFINFIALMSICGIILGITALSTTMSVVNGFDITVREKLLSAIPHITVELYENNNDLDIENILKNNPDILESYPLIQKPLMVLENNKIQLLYANALPEKYLQEKIKGFEMLGSRLRGSGIIISSQAAENLNKTIGDSLTFAIDKNKFEKIKISGIFKNNDTITEKLALLSTNTAKKFGISSQYPTYAIYSKNPLNMTNLTNYLDEKIGDYGLVTTWQQYFAGYFESLQYTKNILFLMLGIIILVAAFNLLATLIMIVTEKYSDIAILRVLGISKKVIFCIFTMQGILLTTVGIILGIISGLLLTNNINYFIKLISKLSGHNLINQAVYIVDYLPTKFSWHEVWVIVGFTLFFAILATLYPAWHACNKKIAEV